MIRPPPRSTRTDTRFACTTLVRSRPLPRPQAPPKPRKADGVLAAVATAHDPNARTPPDPEAIAPPAEVADAAPASATVVVSSPVAGFDGATIENEIGRAHV